MNSIEIVAGRELTLEARDEVNEIHVPIRVVPKEALDGLELKTKAVLRNGLLLDTGLVDCRVDKTTSMPRLVLGVEVAKMARAGVYNVKVQAGPADSNTAPLFLDFTLTRPAAELQLNAPLRLERVALFPCCFWWRPSNAMLNEHSGKSSVSTLTQRWVCELRSDAGQPSGSIRLVLPSTIPAGAQGEISVQEKDVPSLGKSTGKLLVRSPQLASEIFESTVEVTSRICAVWLLIVIGVGIGFGYWVRTELEGRLRRQQADVFAEERNQGLETIINKTQDASLKRDVMAIRAILEAERTKVTATPESIELAARAAETALAERLRRFAEQEANLRRDIATLRADLGLPDRQPPSIANILGKVGMKLNEAEFQANDANLSSAEQIVKQLQETTVGELQDFRVIWTAQLDLLGRCGDWPETSFPALLLRLSPQIIQLNAKNDLKGILQLTPPLQSEIAIRLLKIAFPGILNQAQDIHQKLSLLNDSNLVSSLQTLKNTFNEAESALRAATSEKLEVVVERIRLLREAIVASLQAAHPVGPDGKPAAIVGLAEGKFASVLEEVLSRRETPGIGTQERATLEDNLHLMEQSSLNDSPTPLKSTWQISIEAPSVAVAARPVILRARIIPSTSGIPALSRVRWYINDNITKDDQQTPLEFTLLVSQPSTISVRVDAESSDGQRREARLTLSVGPSDAVAVLPRLIKEKKNTERNLTILSGVLIAIIGFLLYRNVFVGVLGDFATAFFWGFSTDIGLAKVRELSSPLVSRFSPQAATAAGR